MTARVVEHPALLEKRNRDLQQELAATRRAHVTTLRKLKSELERLITSAELAMRLEEES